MATQRIHPFAEQGNWTAVHNTVFDVMMPALPPNAFKVLCLIIRKTVGWKKESDKLAYSQIAKGTGIKSPGTLSAAIKALEDGGYVLSVGGDKWEATSYRLNPALEIEIPITSKNEVEPTTIFVVGSTTEIVVEPTTKIVDTKESIKEKERKGDRAGATAPRTPRKKANKPTAPIGIIEALAKACQIDRELAPKKTHILLAQTASKLHASGQKREQTEQQIIDTIAYVAGYFAKEDWRGKKGEPPTPSTLLEVWPRAIEARARPVITPGANIPAIHASEAPAPRRKTQEELDEIYFKVNGHYPKRRLNA